MYTVMPDINSRIVYHAGSPNGPRPKPSHPEYCAHERAVPPLEPLFGFCLESCLESCLLGVGAGPTDKHPGVI